LKAVQIRSSQAAVRKREAASLDKGLNRRLLAYVAAAGTGILAASQPASAGIIYTPSNATYTTGQGSLGISLENNGTINFNLASGSRSGYFRTLRVNGNGISGDEVVGFKTSISPEASALTKGALIGPGQAFQNANNTTSRWSDVGVQMVGETFGRQFLSGPWADVSDRYLGLKFEVNGQTYYGWIGFSFVGAESSQFGPDGYVDRIRLQ
jgi:hypothetical protein